MADLAGEMSNAQLARFRATGEWGYVDPANPGWAPAYQRAVNKQIRNSPVAMKAVEGATARTNSSVRPDATLRHAGSG
jgi:hypothetical protein